MKVSHLVNTEKKDQTHPDFFLQFSDKSGILTNQCDLTEI